MITWDIDPVALNLGFFGIRWYSLCFLAGFYFGYLYMKKRFTESGYTQEALDSLLMFSMISTILGARLGHVFFYEPEVYLRDPIRIFKVWEGGLASHGATIGSLVGLYIFVRGMPNMKYLWLLDSYVIPIGIAGGLVRLGNLMNSEIIGKPTLSNFGFIFKRIDDIPRHPTQIYESICYFISFFILHFVYSKTQAKQKPGFVLGLFFILIFGFRFFIEFFKEHQADFESKLPLDMGQLLSIPVVLFGLGLMLTAKRRKIPNPAA